MGLGAYVSSLNKLQHCHTGSNAAQTCRCITTSTYHTALQFLSKISLEDPVSVLLPYLLSLRSWTAEQSCNAYEQSVLIILKWFFAWLHGGMRATCHSGCGVLGMMRAFTYVYVSLGNGVLVSSGEGIKA